MKADASRRMRLIGMALCICSLIAVIVGGSWFTATEGWDGILQPIGGLSFWFWWAPGLVGAILLFISRRPHS
jgi:hypothetical protein